MKNYSDYIKGKRIIFVGSAPNLVGKDMGEIIDDHDVVVRTNGAHVKSFREKYKKDYGMKADVVYFNVQQAREIFPLPAKECAADGVKWFCFKTLSPKEKNKYSPYLGVRDIKEVIKKVHAKVHGALMGLFIFEDILQFKPASLKVTGIDFFASKKQVFEKDNYREYLDGYLQQKIIDQGNIINKGKKEDGHNRLANTKYIYDLWNDKKIDMPEHIVNVMSNILVEG